MSGHSPQQPRQPSRRPETDLQRRWGRHAAACALRAGPAAVLLGALAWQRSELPLTLAALAGALSGAFLLAPLTLIEREGLRRGLAPAWGALFCYLASMAALFALLAQGHDLLTRVEGGAVGAALAAGARGAWEFALRPDGWLLLTLLPAPLALACAVQLGRLRLAAIATGGCLAGAAALVGGGALALALRGLGLDSGAAEVPLALCCSSAGLVGYCQLMDRVEARLAGAIEHPAWTPQPLGRRALRWALVAGAVALVVSGARGSRGAILRAQRPELAECLDATWPLAPRAVRLRGLDGLAAWQESPAGIEALYQALFDPDLYVSQAAADALAEIGEPALPRLLRPLANPALPREERLILIRVLAQLGPAARGAREVLLRQSLVPDPEVAVWAVNALYRVDPAAGAARREALERHRQDPQVGALARQLLQELAR